MATISQYKKFPMLYNKVAIALLALVGTGGIGGGSKVLHDILYPKGEEWMPSENEMEWREEVWDHAFTYPGICIEKLFPDILGTSVFKTRLNRVEKNITTLPGPYRMFQNDKPIVGKPAVGCVIMNLKKFEYGKGYWRHAFRGEVVLKTENEGWIWMMGQSTGGGFNFIQLTLKKDKDGKWYVLAGHGGGAGGGVKNLPKKSGFWNLDYHSALSKECLEETFGNNQITNRDICKALKVEDVKSVKWTGVWTENAGNQPFSDWVENPSDMIFSWPPSNKKMQNKVAYTRWTTTRRNIYHEGEWYNDKTNNRTDHMIWQWDDTRKGLWREIREMCSQNRRSGYNREYSDSISDLFCSETKKRRFIGNKGYDNV